MRRWCTTARGASRWGLGWTAKIVMKIVALSLLIKLFVLLTGTSCLHDTSQTNKGHVEEEKHQKVNNS